MHRKSRLDSRMDKLQWVGSRSTVGAFGPTINVMVGLRGKKEPKNYDKPLQLIKA